MRQPIVISWSGGKDCSLALHALLATDLWQPVGLLTTVTGDYDRISMHGVRTDLLRSQAESLGLPLKTVSIPTGCDDEAYRTLMSAALREIRAEGVEDIAFGDIFLEDVRAYREALVTAAEMRPQFPLWGQSTRRLATEFVALGFEAVAVCIDSQSLSPEFAGRRFDLPFLRDLPTDVDPCGERGEFHTFVTAGPIFRSPVQCTVGDTVLRDERFVFCDLIGD